MKSTKYDYIQLKVQIENILPAKWIVVTIHKEGNSRYELSTASRVHIENLNLVSITRGASIRF